MDYSDDQNTWNWHGEDYGVQNNSDSGEWTQVTLNEEHLSYMFDETTPVKDCGDLSYSYHFTHNDYISEEPKDSSQFKRRRMLHFDTHGVESSLLCEEMPPSVFLKSSERGGLIEDASPDASQWVAGFSEDASASSYDGLDQLCEGWLEYFNDADMLLSSDDMNLTAASDVHIDISDLYDARPDAVQNQPTQTSQNVVFKGRKSGFNCPPSKLSSSIAYPFAFIKPCSFHGDVTLNDINKRIQARRSNEDVAAAAFPTSAFSGKPVVGITKIRTDGGKGSITITRTKG
ncbi:X-RAY INDUCED TRANSCRIPT 1, X-RAY INDUCED TRANSCRIPT [Hibiscus trionum]|uniref:X-RAY INDUCED TRANSCRIPT 1, X-RAY INDUCED TRANSCRIPT n=1 Tax=Hibiscus trionum TaxID=183268 RepID=A0A9W7HF79_HIBTR|nr:X-RAY INDUCED TRANSCRIPT 1, X-RAY INDUCED TRANSCRIPT [Hibiscus trionum]